MQRSHPNRRRPPDYFSGPQQLRLLALVFCLGLVVVAMGEARKPSRWRWLWHLGAAAGTAGNQPHRAAASAGGPIRQMGGPGRGRLPNVDPSLLAVIEDNALFRRRERPAWFHLLQILRDHDREEIERASVGPVGFGQLWEQPQRYRGRVVTVAGQVRRTLFVRAPDNASGIHGYHQVVLRPAGGPDRPIVIYALDLPPGFPSGDALHEPVAVTGFFFKNCAFPTADDVHSYPTLLAKSLAWSGPSGTSAPAQSASPPRTFPQVPTTLVPGAEAPERQEAIERQDQPEDLRALWDLVGIGPDAWRRLAKADLLEEANLPLVLKILYQLRRFDGQDIAHRVHHDLSAGELAEQFAEAQGRLHAVTGRVTHVAQVHLPAELGKRFSIDTLYVCQMALAGAAAPATILAGSVPRIWLDEGPLDERAAADGLLLQRQKDDATAPALVFLARRVAWYPDQMQPQRGVNFGLTVLGDLHMDVGLWDQVRDRRPLTAAEREAFYQLLEAVGRAGTRQLERLAQRNLGQLRGAWQREEARLTRQLAAGDGDSDDAAGAGGETAAAAGRSTRSAEERLAATRAALKQAEKGTFSVVPLFNQPDQQRGQLLTLTGTARRAVKIYVDASAPVQRSADTAAAALDHYYELDVFTADSRNYPVVFCLRELPPGFPEGDVIQEPVRIAGFYFKAWAYRAPGRAADRAAEPRDQTAWHVAPLLVGRGATWIQTNPAADSGRRGLWAGAAFALLLAVVWLAIWTTQRGDRRFLRQRRAGRDQPPVGLALEELAESDRDGNDD